MNEGRLEAFSDGVFAIIITIMVLDLRVPSGPSLRSTVPVFLSYVLSFVYVGIYSTSTLSSYRIQFGLKLNV
jgi:uncharacterized membrane protein